MSARKSRREYFCEEGDQALLRRNTKSQVTPRKKKLYFDVEGDHRSQTIRSQYTEDTEESSDSVLTWRGKPEITGAEVPIVVVTNELDTTTYHVHREVLMYGDQQCKYFSNVIERKESRARSKRSPHRKGISIKIELDQVDAKNFPLVLDFMYSNSQHSLIRDQCIHRRQVQTKPSDLSSYSGTLSFASLTAASSHSMLKLGSMPTNDDDEESCQSALQSKITMSNAVSLRHLAIRFENTSLLRAVNKFIQKDLSYRTVSVYLSKATEYNDQRLLESAQRLYLENFEHMDAKAITRLPVNLFRSLVKSFETLSSDDNSRYSEQLSVFVCNYLEKHPELQTTSLLIELTDSLVMPVISAEAAIGFTAIIKCLDVNESTEQWPRLVRFCQRCAKAVVHEYGWSDFCVDAAVQEYLSKMEATTPRDKYGTISSPVDGLLFATSFAAALSQAQDDYEEISTAHEELDSMVSLLDQSSSQWESLSQKQDKHIEKQKRALVDARREIADLKREVEELRRDKTQQKAPRRPTNSSPNRPPTKRSIKDVPARNQLTEETNDPILDIPKELDVVPMKNLISPAQLGQLHALRNRRKQELKLRHSRRRSSVRGALGVLTGEKK